MIKYQENQNKLSKAVTKREKKEEMSKETRCQKL